MWNIARKQRLLNIIILTLFLSTLYSQTKTIKFKKIDSTAVVFSLAKMTNGLITVEEILADPLIRLETKNQLTVKYCEIMLAINGRIYIYDSPNCSELTEEQLSLIDLADGQFKNKLYIDAIALDENKKEVRLKTIALTIISKKNSE